jgi:hypothetical protein
MDAEEKTPIEVLTEELLRAEEALARYGFQTPAFVVLDERVGATLHFRRGGARWGLYVRTDPMATEVEIKRAPKRLRIAAGMQLEELYAELLRAEEREEHEIAIATERVRGFREAHGVGLAEETSCGS